MKLFQIVPLAGVLCLAASVQAGEKSPVEPKPNVPWEIKQAADGTPIQNPLYAAIKSDRWPEAISLTRSYMNQRFYEPTILREGQSVAVRDDAKELEAEANWEITLGKLYLYDLQSKQAAQHFFRVRQLIQAPKNSEFDRSPATLLRRVAANNLASTFAQRGQFHEASKWLRQGEDESNHWCGNCAEGENLHNYAILSAWKVAGDRSTQRRTKLNRLIHGGLKAQKSQLFLRGDVTRYQKEVSAREAKFRLAEECFRNQEREQAAKLFRPLAHSDDEMGFFARTYLRRLGAPLHKKSLGT